MPVDLRRAEPSYRGVFGVVLGCLTLLVALLTIEVTSGWDPFGDFDRTLTRRATDATDRSGLLLDLGKALAVAFNTWPVVALVAAVIAWAAWRREWGIAAWITVSGLVVVLGNPALKALVDRPRPPQNGDVYEIGGWSFPSGHAAGAGLLLVIAVMLTIVTTGRGLKRRLLITLWAILAAAVAASRVFLGVHYPTDVVAGLAFGSGVTLALWLLLATDATRLPSELAMLTGTGGKKAAVVLNPAKVGDVEEFKNRVRAAAKAHGWSEPLWFETSVEDPGYGQSLDALAAGVDLIVAAGGDGTVRAVCEEAARTGVAVGVIPHGTGNLLARNLDIPLNSRDALDVAFGGQDKAIDLARYRTDSGVDTSFLVMAGLGMDAMIMTGVDDDLKKRVGYLAYFVSGLKALRFPGMKVTITVDDGEPQTMRARTVVIGNVGFLQGGIPLLPEARIDDGQLDVVVLAPRRFLGWLGIAWKVITRRKRNTERFARFTGARVHIQATSDTPMQLDGDPVGEGTEITAEVRPGVVLVRVPVVPIPAG
ncbi:MAG: diacylglycerol kinase family protein [Aeromicrobium sp.]|uniref:phosphatase PAP2 family protein n=1 Tax=Aeromicrobium sp. TaxID=1871063 RepID=UPI0039E5BAC3